jgi:hypothetical protein
LKSLCALQKHSGRRHKVEAVAHACAILHQFPAVQQPVIPVSYRTNGLGANDILRHLAYSEGRGVVRRPKASSSISNINVLTQKRFRVEAGISE